jgi:type II secretory pathway pseudopilin PulG
MADLKLDTLIKVLLMTTSDNNSEALAALRAANKMLRTANTDWEKLLRGKVTVVADPFADIPAPPRPATDFSHNSRPTVPSRPQPDYSVSPPPYQQSRPAPTYTRPTPRAPHSYSPQAARRNNTNSFNGYCYNCNDPVDAGYGALRDVSGRTHVFCEDCNFRVANGSLSMSTVIQNSAARKKNQQQNYTPRTKRKVTTKDLMSDIFDKPDTNNVDY